MKILFISHKYPPAIGGMEKHAFELLTRLAEVHEVIPLIYNNKEGRFAFFRKLEKRAKRCLKEHADIDLIYVNEGLLACFVARFKRWTKIPIVATIHGLDIVFPNVFYQYFVKKQLSKLDGLIAVSRATQEVCIERGISPNKVFIVPNGVDHELAVVKRDPEFLSKFEEKYQLQLQNKKVLVTMGRPVKRKGFSWMVKKVMPYLSKDTILVLVGPRKGIRYPFLNYLPSFISRQLEVLLSIANDEKELVKGTQISANKHRILEVGKLPFEEVVQLLKMAHLFVMPNKKVLGDMEGFGLVALEAAISGTPVVASGIEGIKDAVHEGGNGYLLPAESPSVWIDKIKDILKQEKALTQFSQEVSPYTIAEFSWEKMVKAYNRIFLDLDLKSY